MNMTLDGFCDHTAMIADDEIHQHYTELLNHADTLIYGRKTFELMEYWRTVVEVPTGIKATDDFAVTIDRCAKIVYSRTLESVDWRGSELKQEIDKGELLKLKEQPGKDILVGSPSLIIALTNLGIVDEFQFSVHPTILGNGLQLFNNVTDRIDLRLTKTKTFGCGAITLYYEPSK